MFLQCGSEGPAFGYYELAGLLNASVFDEESSENDDPNAESPSVIPPSLLNFICENSLMDLTPHHPTYTL